MKKILVPSLIALAIGSLTSVAQAQTAPAAPESSLSFNVGVTSDYRYRGLSRFGLGFSLMAASCGPHHLMHGWCVLQGGAVTTPMLLVTLTVTPVVATNGWAKNAGGLTTDRGNSIAVDGSGNSYITGSFQGTATFETTTLTSAGGEDVFIHKIPAQ